MRNISISENKTLILENVLIYQYLQLLQDNYKKENLLNIDAIFNKIENAIISKGANVVGPFIQYIGNRKNNNFEPYLYFMVQSNKYIKNIEKPFTMEPIIKTSNCLYTRYSGNENEITFAYQKMQVYAYEHEMNLKGDSFTIFLDSKDNGEITTDIFMEIQDE